MVDPNFPVEDVEPAPLGRLTHHPLSSMFPMMSEAELTELIADIEKHGQQQPIVLYEGQILDGHNRHEACLKIGITNPLTVEYDGKDPLAFVMSANLHRRHLTQAQKQEVIDKLLKEQPERSDRSIGKLAQVDHKTVGNKRAELEERGEIPHYEKREDSKGRFYPARRERAPSLAQPAIGSAASREAREASAVRAFSRVLHEGDIYRHLNDLLFRLLDDQQKRIADLPKIQREQLARGFLALLDITADDLRPIVAVPAFEGGLLSGESSEITARI